MSSLFGLAVRLSISRNRAIPPAHNGETMIRTTAGLLLVLVVALLSSHLPAVGAAPPPFFHQDAAQDAARLQAALKKLWNPAGKAAKDWRREADDAVKAGDNRRAMGAFGADLALEPQDAKSWLALAKAIEATEPVNDPEKTTFNEYATGASFTAYQLGQTPALKAEALAVLAEALKRREFWRPALGAYKASLALVDHFQAEDVRRKIFPVGEALDAQRRVAEFGHLDHVIASLRRTIPCGPICS